VSSIPKFPLTLPRKSGVAPARARSRSGSPVALRWTFHMLARLAITVTWTSSAAAFDAEHALAAAGAMAGPSRMLDIRAAEVEPSHSLSRSPAVDPVAAPPPAKAAQRLCVPFSRNVE
jgi:hypothetical protein